MKILVTGGLGYLGGRLAEWLFSRGETPILAVRAVPPAAQRWASRFQVRIADVLDQRAVANAVTGVDAVLHLASLDEREAENDPKHALDVSTTGTRNVVASAMEAGVARIVFFSTFHVVRARPGARITEASPVEPRHPYSIAHYEGEVISRSLGGPGRVPILRLSNGYGAPAWRAVDRWSLAHNDFCRQSVTDGRIRLATNGSQSRDFVWVEDIARAAHLVLGAPDSALGDGLFNVGGENSLTILELARRVARTAGRLLAREVSVELGASPAEPGLPVEFSIERLRRLGFAPTDAIDAETDRILKVLAGEDDESGREQQR